MANSSSPDIAADTIQTANKLPMISTQQAQQPVSDIDNMEQTPNPAEKSRKDWTFEMDKATQQVQQGSLVTTKLDNKPFPSNWWVHTG